MRLLHTNSQCYLAVTTLALVVTIASSSSSASASSSASSDHLSAPYDVACLNSILPAQSSDDAQELCDGTLDATGQPCVWCDAAGVFGLCLSSVQSKQASTYLTCDSTNKAIMKNPLDPTCSIAAWNTDDAEATCHDTLDSEGATCIWCTLPGQPAGICVNSEQANAAGQYLTCQNTKDDKGDEQEDEEEEIENENIVTDGFDKEEHEATVVSHPESYSHNNNLNDNPYDITCVLAGYTGGDQGESVCKEAQDQDGDTCVWCSLGSQGVCLTDAQSEIAQQLNLDCDSSPRQIKPHADEKMTTLTSPFDATCAFAGFNAGSDAQNTCTTSKDQDGVACSWCLTANLCLSHDQMDLAKTMGVACEDEKTSLQDNRFDVTCLTAGYSAGADGEETCKVTKDMDGDKCVWCTLGNKGACMTDYQASVAAKWNAQCEASVQPEVLEYMPSTKNAIDTANNYDVSCILTGLASEANGEAMCSISQDDSGDSCNWCSLINLCMTLDQKKMVENSGISCDNAKDGLNDSPYDISCVLTGYSEGEDSCKTAEDQDGTLCVWCSMGDQGLCLTETQSEIAQQLNLECGESSITKPHGLSEMMIKKWKFLKHLYKEAK